jgi:hypothetical protein
MGLIAFAMMSLLANKISRGDRVGRAGNLNLAAEERFFAASHLAAFFAVDAARRAGAGVVRHWRQGRKSNIFLAYLA